MGAKIRPSTPERLKIGANTTTMITEDRSTGWRTSTEVSNTTCRGFLGWAATRLRRSPE